MRDNLLLKIICLFGMITLGLSGLFGIDKAFAYYSDNEDAKVNTHQAGTLDFSLESLQDNFGPRPEVALNMMPGDLVARTITIENQGSLDFQYNGRTEKINGDDDFCGNLWLTAKLGGFSGETRYEGWLSSFELSKIVLSSGSEDLWFFSIHLPHESDFVNKICEFKFVFDGWQDNVENYTDSGFTDVEEISGKLASWGIRINEVYYDVAIGYGKEHANEWIEIYNPLSNPIDISGWRICDNISCDTIPASNPIPAKGFAIITASSTTWNYWNIPDKVVKIVLLDGRIGNGLANKGDRVILRRPDKTEADAMSYGDDTYAFVPACPDVDEGHSLARRIAGYDTNQASDWEDLINPNPGTNPHPVYSEQSSNQDSSVEEENNWVELTPEEQVIRSSPEEGAPVTDDASASISVAPVSVDSSEGGADSTDGAETGVDEGVIDEDADAVEGDDGNILADGEGVDADTDTDADEVDESQDADFQDDEPEPNGDGADSGDGDRE